LEGWEISQDFPTIIARIWARLFFLFSRLLATSRRTAFIFAAAEYILAAKVNFS